LLYPAFPSLTCLSLTISSFGYHSFYTCYVTSFFLVLQLSCPICTVLACQFTLSQLSCPIYTCLLVYPVPAFLSHILLLVSLACPGSHVSCVFLCTLHSPWIGRRWI
jgi:hypothetical protein